MENTKNKKMIDVMNEKDITKKDINSFSKSLNKEQKATIDETFKLVENRSDNLVGGDTTDSQLVFNFAYKLKDVLPIKNFFRGRDEKNFKQLGTYTTSDMKMFTDVVLCVAMGKPADEIKENDSYFYRVLRDIAVSVVYELKYNVIKKDIVGKFFNQPTGRQPKKIFIDFSDANKYDKLKTKYTDNKPADYVSFQTFNAIANFRLLGKESDGDGKTTLLRKLESLQSYLVKNKILSSDPEMKAQEIDAVNFVVSDLMLMLDQANEFLQIADTLTFIADDESDLDLDEKVRLVNFHKHIGNIEFVKYDKMKKAKAIVADSGDSFLQQVKQVQ
tara:strand:+ start:188 stop:1180 length:993 start_codon:yes stop_codon:yes gene_type:complete